jgi:two-component system cell cycle response regulator DivK
MLKSFFKKFSGRKPSDNIILIVEDIQINFMLLNNILTRMSYPTLHAPNGAIAVEMCRQNPKITFVFMDISMPVMNGFEATQEIKKFRPELPIVAVTAYTEDNTRDEAIAVGCNDYITKPVTGVTILDMLQKFGIA